MTTLILTAYGADRPGLVQSVADAVHGCGGNWLDSHLSHLAGMFVGSILIDLPEEQVPALEARLRDPAGTGMNVMLVRPSSPAAAADSTGRLLRLDIVGQDRPGIVREVTGVLAGLGINIQEFSTDLANSPWSGDPLFKAGALLQVPHAVGDERLRAALERVSAEIMVDIALAAPEGASPSTAAA